jgi:dihydrofolate synthase/folylpolyglutamate synthase
MLASILQEAGYKVDYILPHLKDFRERIKIYIKNLYVILLILTSHFEANDISFFEMSVGLAFSYFKKEQVDISIIEVGMGGRLDAQIS